MKYPIQCLLLLVTLLTCSGHASELNNRYAVNGIDWPPVAAFYDTQTSSTVGVLRFDARGIQIYDLTCGSDPEFRSFLADFIAMLQGTDGQSSTTAASPESSSPLDASTTSAKTAVAAAIPPGLILDELASTETERIRELVEKRGPAGGLRAMAAEQMYNYAMSVPETTSTFTFASYGTLSGMIHTSGYIAHPKQVADIIRGHEDFEQSEYVEIHASVASEAGYLQRLADILDKPTQGPDWVISHRGFSSVDHFLYSERELVEAEQAAREGHSGAAFVLFQHYDNMALTDVDNQKDLLKLAHEWLYKSAEGGLPVGQYNAAYLAVWKGLWPKEKAAEWIGKLKAKPDELKKQPFVKDLEYLKQDLEDSKESRQGPA